MTTPRRTFLKQVGLLSAISLVEPARLFAAAPTSKVGLQLYTLREYIDKDVKGVLAKVAKAGYQDVETYGYSLQKGYWGLPAKEFKAVLAANGLTTSAGHYDLNDFMRTGDPADVKSYLEAATACGQRTLVVPYLDEKLRTTPADFKALAVKINKLGELCKAAGLRVAYHNHDFEFKTVGGTSLYTTLLKETDPALVDLELDIYWVVRAGKDPLALFKQHPGRFSMWHVKDMDKAKPERNTEIGTGSIDFKKLMQQASTAGLKQLYVEQENFSGDAYQSLTQSAAYVKTKLLS